VRGLLVKIHRVRRPVHDRDVLAGQAPVLPSRQAVSVRL